jgi:hypothetical protein
MQYFIVIEILIFLSNAKSLVTPVYQGSTGNTTTEQKRKETIFPQTVVLVIIRVGGEELLTLERKITGPMIEVSSF